MNSSKISHAIEHQCTPCSRFNCIIYSSNFQNFHIIYSSMLCLQINIVFQLTFKVMFTEVPVKLQIGKTTFMRYFFVFNDIVKSSSNSMGLILYINRVHKNYRCLLYLKFFVNSNISSPPPGPPFKMQKISLFSSVIISHNFLIISHSCLIRLLRVPLTIGWAIL